MNISYNWLKEYLDTDLTPQEVSAALTSIGLETEGIEEIETIKGGLEGIVVGEVLTCVDHPNSDHLHVTTVNVGADEPLHIVCGAPNVAAGQKVMVATVGTKLYSGEESFTIKKSKIRGEESFGMICAEDEIGVGTSHDGIIVLPADTKPGTLAKDYYQVSSEYVLEVDITPNRVDAASHWGVARDLAAYLQSNKRKATLTKPSVDSFNISQANGAIGISVENSEACPRYAGLTIKDVEVKESPEWMKDRLKAIGLHPINNIVDVTNFVLHELGHPLHAFDADQISGGKVIIKTMPEGTKFVTLDGEERTLSERDLMICNDREPMCIAGVFGGLKSGVSAETKNIFLECAYFNPTWVRKTARRHGLSTDASFRFERGCDPNDVVYVLKRTALLLQSLAGGEIVGDIQDFYPQTVSSFAVTLAYAKVNSLIGKELPKDTVKNILASLEIKIVGETDDSLALEVPTYRVDVQRDVDVIEDILRIYGYNNVEIGDSVKSNLSVRTDVDKSYDLQNMIAEQLTGSGFHEILNNSLTAEGYYTELTTFPADRCVRLLNPLSSDLSVMRQTLLFGGLESISYNINRKSQNLKFYEFGSCYYHCADQKKEGVALSEYGEDFRLGLWLCGNNNTGSWLQKEQAVSFFELKAEVENILCRLGVSTDKYEYKQINGTDCFGAMLEIMANGKVVGTMGIVNKKLAKALDVETEVYFAELKWEMLMKLIRKHQVNFSEISKYPAVKRDLALLVDKSVLFDDIRKVAFNTEKKLLKRVSLFDVYEGKNLPEGKKSYAVNFVLQDEEKTLNDKQIDALMKKIQTSFETKLGAQLR